MSEHHMATGTRRAQPLNSPLRAVLFDAFGTLVEIKDKRSPFNRLRELAGLSAPSPRDFGALVMTAPHDLTSVAALYPQVLRSNLDVLQHELQQKLDSMQLFPDVIDALTELKTRGLKIGICSNLASPYARFIRLLYPLQIDALSWSFEVGTMKPDPKIYDHACKAFGCAPSSVLMVGDKEQEDFRGPISVGMQAIRLRRVTRTSEEPSISSLALLPAKLQL